METVTCKRCNTTNEFYVEYSGPHIKAICNHCDTYIKFVKKENSRPPENVVTKNMANSTGMYGSLCLEDIFEGMIQRAQDGSQWVNINACLNGPFNVSQKNGKHYVNIVEWIHPEPDQHGQNAGIHLSMEKGAKEQGIKPKYIGNMRYMQQPQSHAPYNANPQYGPPQYQQPQQNWGGQGNAGPGGFTSPFAQPQQRPGPVPPQQPSYGQQPAQYQPQQPQQYPQQYQPQGPQPVTQQMIHDANRQQPQGPPQFGPQAGNGTPSTPGAWTPAINKGVDDLPF